MEKKTYKVKFVKYEILSGHVEYTVKVIASNGSETFHLRDRYRSMRNYWRSMVSDYGKAVPAFFPPKKWFNNKEPEFIRHRMEELEHFFNTLLEDPKLASCPLTQTYFTNRKAKVTTEQERGPKPAKGEGAKGHTGKAPVEGASKPAAPAVTANKAVNDKKWRQIVDAVTKTYIDISFGEEPPAAEEVKKKSMAYSAAIGGSLSAIPYISKLLSLPKVDEKRQGEPALAQIEDERPMSDWLSEKMDIIAKCARNGDNELYQKDPIYFKFEMNL